LHAPFESSISFVFFSLSYGLFAQAFLAEHQLKPGFFWAFGSWHSEISF